MPRTERWRSPGLWLLLATALAYANSFGGVYQFDDYPVIVQQPVVQDWSALRADLGIGIRPLLKLSYALCWWLGDGAIGPFHALNLLIHIGCVLLVLALGRRLYARTGLAPQQAGPAALLAALIFALHPVQTEAVTYICGRSTSLAAFWMLLSLWAWAHHAAHTERQGAAGFWGLSFAAFLAALASKETALVLPLLLVLWDALSPPGARPARTHRLPFWLVVAVALLVVVPHSRYDRFFAISLSLKPLGDQALAQLHGAVWLLRGLLLWRVPNLDPALPAAPPADAPAAFMALLLAGALLMAWRLRRRWPGAPFCAAWAIVLLPTNSLLPRLDVANDRQWYLPLAGVAWSVSAGLVAVQTTIARQLARPALAWLAPAGLLLTLGGLTLARNADYGSEARLWQQTLAQSPTKARAWNNLGIALLALPDPETARVAFAQSLALDPGFADARHNLQLLPDTLAVPGHDH